MHCTDQKTKQYIRSLIINKFLIKTILTFIIGSFLISNLFSQNILYTNITPTVIDTNEVFSFYIKLEPSAVDSIQVSGFYTKLGSTSNNYNLIQNGQFVDTLILKDDGLDQDLEANDNIYTASNLNWDWEPHLLERMVCSSIFINEGNVVLFSPSGNEIMEDFSFQIGIRFFDKTTQNLPVVNSINDSIQHTDYVINIVKDQKFGTEWRPEFFKNHDLQKLEYLFDDIFLNDNHELIFGFSYPTWEETASAFHKTLKNDVEGICMEIKAEEFPAEGYTVMSWGTMAPTLYVHEYYHRYRDNAYCSFNGMGKTFHWHPIDLPTSGFNPAFSDFEVIDSNSVSVKVNWPPREYNALDEYFLGIGDIDDIPWPLKYIAYSNTYTTDPNDGTRRIYDAEMKYITKEEFLEEAGGLRNPPSEPDTVKTSLIVYSHYLLEDHELAYYENAMKVFENNSNTSENVNLNYASNGKLNQCTKLRKRMTTNLYPTKQTQFIIFPNPSSGRVFIEQNQIKNFEVTAFNIIGEQVFNCSNCNEFDLSTLSNGSYYIKIVDTSNLVSQNSLLIISN